MPVTKVRDGSSSLPSHSPPANSTSLPPSSTVRCSSTHRIDADELAVLVGIARAGAGAARPDAAEHRAGVAAHDPLALGRAEFLRARFDGELVGGAHARSVPLPAGGGRGRIRPPLAAPPLPGRPRTVSHRGRRPALHRLPQPVRQGRHAGDRAPVAWRMAERIAGAVAISAGSPTPLAPNGPVGLGVLDQVGLDRAACRRRSGSDSRAGSRCGRG